MLTQTHTCTYRQLHLTEWPRQHGDSLWVTALRLHRLLVHDCHRLDGFLVCLVANHHRREVSLRLAAMSCQVRVHALWDVNLIIIFFVLVSVATLRFSLINGPVVVVLLDHSCLRDDIVHRLGNHNRVVIPQRAGRCKLSTFLCQRGFSGSLVLDVLHTAACLPAPSYPLHTHCSTLLPGCKFSRFLLPLRQPRRSLSLQPLALVACGPPSRHALASHT